MENLFFSKTNKRSDLREDLWLNEFKKIAVSLSEPISLGCFAPQSSYQKEDYLEMATFLSVNGLSADQGCDLFNKLRIKLRILENEIFLKSASSTGFKLPRKNQTRLVPNKTCFLERVREQSIEDLEVEWNHCMKGLLKFLKKKAKLKGKVRIAFDYHEVPFYGDHDLEFVHKNKAKLGTNYFFKYITCNICVAGYRVELGMKMLKKKEKSVDWVREWLERLLAIGIKIEWVLLDRGFYSISTCKMIDQLGLKFLMPAKKFEPIKKLALQYYNKKIPNHYNYILKNSCDEFKGTLIFATERGNLNVSRRDCQKAALSDKQVVKKIWVYFTNWCLPKDVRAHLRAIREIPGIYKSRWGIETSYRMIDEFHIPTSSKTPSIRYFFFIFQALMYNCWIITNLVLTFKLNLKRSQITVRCATFKFEIGLILTQTPNHSKKPPPKTKKSSKFARIRKFFRRN